VLVEVAEARALPAAEGVVGQRHRDRHVDADHADIDLRLAKSRAASPSRVKIATPLPYSCSLAAERLLVVFGAHHREDRAEDLLLVDAHVRRHVVEQAAADEEAVLVALQLKAAAVDDELGALLRRPIDIADHAAQGAVTSGP
jgi:hypothetical protein